MTQRILAAAAAAMTTIVPSVFAQDNIIPPSRFGVHLGLGLNSPSASVQTWRGYQHIDPAFGFANKPSARMTDGSMVPGLAANLLFGVPLTSTIHFSGRLGYNNLSTDIAGTQDTSTTSVSSSFESSLATLEITPAFEFYNLIRGVNIHPIVGLELGIPLNSTFTQTVSYRQQNSNGTETVATGADIPNTTIRAAFLVGAGYTFRIDSSWYVQPEITYRLPLTNVSGDEAYSPWKVGQLRLGVNIFFGFSESASSPAARSTSINASMGRITAFDRDGREYDVSELTVEDVRYNEMFPLVPYMFTNEGQPSPGADLQTGGIDPMSGDFLPESLPLDAVEVNRNLLNVIGARLKKTPQATLTITGTTDGKELGKNGDRDGLARKRAEWAKAYLVSSFGIDADRIAIRTSATPARPSSTTDPDGIAENRRVEFSSNVPDILAPVVITADNQRVSTPDLVNFHPVVESDDSVSTWSLEIMQAGRPLRSLQGRGRPSTIGWSIKPNDLSSQQVPVDFEFTARTVRGDSTTVVGTVPVDYVSSVRKRTENLPDRTVDKYSLILFDFDKATLNEDNQRILEMMVLPSIRANSRVSVIGYTDRIGSDDYNKKLSAERAQTVRLFLQSRAKDASYSSSGVGESTEIFPNASPIGRQLSRTVQVIVETPRR